jgi:ABC-2 type transport system ATP-binding protein
MSTRDGEVVAVQGLTKRFGDVVALDAVSFTIRGPGVTGILGPNGAGKTTLLDVLEGLAAPTSGEVRLFGRPIHPYPRRDVGVVMQREVQLDRTTTREYAELFAAIYGVEGGAATILARANLADRSGVSMSRLSGGEAARLFLATAMVHDPKLLFLDEPTAQLDPKSKREVGALLREAAAARTVVITTHDLREAEALCDDCIFLVGGKLRASGPKDELVAAAAGAAPPSMEDAFFHFCAVRMKDGDVEAPP